MCFLLQEPARAGKSFTWTGEGKDECQQNYPDKSAPDDSAQLAPTGSIPAHVILGENLTLASLNVEAGSWLTDGKVTVTRSLGWTGGSLGARLEMAAWSVGNIDGPDTKQLNGLLNNRGSVSLAPDARLGLVGGANVNNFGTFTAQHGARISGLPGCVDSAVINNSGTFMVTSGLIPLPGTDTVTVSGTSFNAGGMIVNVSSGVLELHSPPGKIAASTRFTGDGTVKIIDNADTTMLGSFSVAPRPTSSSARARASAAAARCSGPAA